MKFQWNPPNEVFQNSKKLVFTKRFVYFIKYAIVRMKLIFFFSPNLLQSLKTTNSITFNKFNLFNWEISLCLFECFCETNWWSSWHTSAHQQLCFVFVLHFSLPSSHSAAIRLDQSIQRFGALPLITTTIDLIYIDFRLFSNVLPNVWREKLIHSQKWV